MLIESIQLICSSNLDLNKFRRVMVARHLQPHLRKQILKLPVTHNSCFGEDFSKATDNIIKEQSAIEKVIYKKPAYLRLSYSAKRLGNSNFKQSFRGKGGRGSSRGGSSRGSYLKTRGRGRGTTRSEANSSFGSSHQ